VSSIGDPAGRRPAGPAAPPERGQAPPARVTGPDRVPEL